MLGPIQRLVGAMHQQRRIALDGGYRCGHAETDAAGQPCGMRGLLHPRAHLLGAQAGGFTVDTGQDQHEFLATITRDQFRSEEHTSELQSLMRISYAVFCLKKTNRKITRLNSNPKCAIRMPYSALQPKK